MNSIEEFGIRIAQCRQNKHMTQEELARKVGVTPQALSKWERSISLPDLTMVRDLCRILDVSSDYLLVVENHRIVENDNPKAEDEIWKRLRNCLEQLELTFGKNLVRVFQSTNYVEEIIAQRKKLALQGILMPVVRVRDDMDLETDEIKIVAYGKELFSEILDTEDGKEELVCQHIMECLGETVSKHYADILNRELVKELVDNLKIKAPVLISETIPQRISYGLLTEVLKELLTDGMSMVYLEKVIDRLDRVLRENPEAKLAELVCDIREMVL